LGVGVKFLDEEIKSRRERLKTAKPKPAPAPDIKALEKSARKIIDCDDVLQLFENDFAEVVAGEKKLGQLLYLIATSRLLDQGMHAAIKGTSAGGKSNLRKRVLEFFPQEDVIEFTALSDKALLYRKDDFSHKILSMGEALAGKEQEFQNAMIRQLMSENKLTYLVPMKVEGEIETVTVEKNGPVTFMIRRRAICSTRKMKPGSYRWRLMTASDRPKR